jgi:hypothetical protein
MMPRNAAAYAALRACARGGPAMTLCPIALAVGCRKCPAFSACPLKSVIGDQPKAGAAPPAAPSKDGAKPKR